jgi:Transposase IS116/IS110/IS902 family
MGTFPRCARLSRRNRRALGAYAGLAGTPFSSGGSEREQGIGKDGNRRVRAAMVELAWLWLRWRQHLVGLVPRASRDSRRPNQEDHDRGAGPQASHRPMALRQGRRHSGGREDEDGMRTTFISLYFRPRPAVAVVPTRTRKGAVFQKGTAARNSFSRMPGSWSGIADPTGYEVGRKNPVSQIGVHPRSEIGA